MSRAGGLKERFPIEEPETVEVNVATICDDCGVQPDEVKYSRVHHLLFWECPNGHKGYIEDFEL